MPRPPALPEPGHELAQAIAPNDAVLPVVLGEAGRTPRVKARFVYRGTSDPFGFAPRFTAASGPSALLEANATGLAAANLAPDSDGVVRRVPVAFRLGDGLVPGMAAEALRLLSGRADISVVSDERDPLSFLSGIGIAGLDTGKGLIPTGKDGRAWLRYEADSRPLDASVLGALPLKGAVVVIGLEGKVVQTPLGPDGTASVVAQSIENLLRNSVLIRPSWAKLAEALFLAGAGAAMIVLLRIGLAESALLRHLSDDSLVGWAWSPGAGRMPAPGSQAEFGALMRAWAGAGALPAPMSKPTTRTSPRPLARWLTVSTLRRDDPVFRAAGGFDAIDRDRGTPRGGAPPTPPVRTTAVRLS